MIQLNFSYKPLFKLMVLHHYFAENTSRDLRLTPTADTQKLVQKLGLIMKENDGEYRVLYDTEKVDGLLSEVKQKSMVRFTYLLYCANPYFINFTDVPFEGGQEVFYFTNELVTSTKEEIFLHQKEAAGVKDRFPLKSSVEVFAQGGDKLIELKNDRQEVVFMKKLGAGEKMVLTNQVAPLGKYHLFENGKQVSSFVLFTDSPIVKPIALVEISLSGKIKEEFITGVEEGEIPFYNYKVVFSARNTFWKYFFVAKYNSNLKNTTIDSGDSSCKFKGPEQVKMKSGEDAVMFVSDGPLPLKQIQEYRFQLKNVRLGIANGKTIIDRLPSPSPEIIKPESRDNNSKVFSEIIVHI